MSKIRPVLLAVLVILATGCGSFKPIARTVLDIARAGCEMFAAEQGLSLSDVCATEKQLQPFVDGLLAAKRQHGALRGATGAERCSDAPASSAATVTPPEPAVVPAPAPVPAPATPAEPEPVKKD